MDPMRSSTSAIHQMSSYAPSVTYCQSAISLPLSMEWMTARSGSLPDLPAALVQAVVPISRSHSAPGIASQVRRTQKQRLISSLPDTMLGSLLLYSDYGTHKARRMSCRSYRASLAFLIPPVERLLPKSSNTFSST